MKNIVITATVAAISLSGCAHKKQNFQGKSQESIYENAVQNMKNSKKITTEDLEYLEDHNPEYAKICDVMMLKIYGYYTNKDYDHAIISANRFIKLYPNDKNTPYVYYIKGLSNYNRTMDISRDQKRADDAMQTFNDLIARFPDSEYAIAAKTLFEHLRNMIAAKNMEIGKFYEKRAQYGGAADRFLSVIKEYNNTMLAPEAHYRMFEIYTNLGMESDATRYLDMMQKQYPDSIWTKTAIDSKVAKHHKKTK